MTMSTDAEKTLGEIQSPLGRVFWEAGNGGKPSQ